MKATTLSLLLGLAFAGAAACQRGQTPPAKAPEPPPPPLQSPPAPAEPATEPAAPPPLEGEALGQHYVACWRALNRADWNQLANCYADDAVSHRPDSGQPDARGPEAIIEGVAKGYKDAFPDAQGSPQLVLVNGREVASIVWLRGTHEGLLTSARAEIPASKKTLSELVFHAVTFNEKNGVSAEWLVEDFGSVMYQLGPSLDDSAPGAARAARPSGLEPAPVFVIASGSAEEASNVEAVKHRYQLSMQEDVKALSLLLADDVVESDQSAPADVKGKKNVAAGQKRFFAAFGKIKYECPSVWGAGAYVVARCNLSAVHDGNFGRLKKSGRTLVLTLAEVQRLEGGKLEQVWRFFDSAAFAAQLGAPGRKPPAATTREPD